MSRVGSFLSNLFSGQPQAPANSAPLRAYGKLPLYAEYRRLDVSPGTPTAYSQWLDSGRLAWMQAAGGKHEPGEKQPAMVSSRLMLQVPGSKEWVVGCLWDSRDNVGRIFPFSFFVVCAADALGADAVERWAAALSIFEQLEAQYGRLKLISGGGDFYKHYQRVFITLKPEDLSERVRLLLEQAAKLEAMDWYQAANLGAPSPQEWFSTISKRTGRWITQPEAFGRSAVSCPIAAPFSADVQAVVWLRWLDALSRAAGKSPDVIAPAAMDGQPRMLHAIVRDLMPDDFQLLTTQAAKYGFVENLSKIPPRSPESSDSLMIHPPSGSLLSWMMSQTAR